MPLKLLVGKSTYGTSTTGYVSPRVAITLFEAVLSGRATEFWALAGVSSANLLGAIYDDEDNGNLIWECTTDTATTADTWAKQDIDETVDIEDGTTYGLAAMGDSTNVIKQESGQTGTLSRLQVGGLGAYGDGFPDPGTYSQQIKYTDRNYVYQVWGWEPPTITSFNGGSSVEDGDTGVSIVGTDFMTSVGTGKVELCNNSSYASATVKVEQTDTAWGDTGITATIVQGALSAGTVYAFVTTDIGQVNATGYSVTLTAGASIPTGEDVDLENAAQTASGTGFSVPDGQSVSLANGEQTASGTGYAIPVGTNEGLENGAQVFYGTGSAIEVPVGQTVNLVNGEQTASATGYSVPVSNGQNLSNAAQSFAGIGNVVALVPTGQAANLTNAAQSLSSGGFTIATGENESLENAAQTFYGTGSVPLDIPTSVSASFVNAAQDIDADGYTIAVSESAALNNAAQSFDADGFTIPVSGATDLENGAQTFYGTGDATNTIPTGQPTNWSNHAQTISASGYSIPAGQGVALINAAQTFYGYQGSPLGDPIGYITLDNIIEAITLNSDISPITLNNTGDV